jgi:hypothetical protein
MHHLNRRSGVPTGTIAKLKRLIQVICYWYVAWRVPNTSRISESNGLGWRFFEWFSQKILPVHCLEKSPLNNSDNRDKFQKVV